MKAISFRTIWSPLLFLVVIGISALAVFWWHAPQGLLFSSHPALEGKPEPARETRLWIPIKVPQDFHGSTQDFLKKYGLLHEPDPGGRNTNWYLLDDCQPRPILENDPPKGQEFWFAGGPAPVLPSSCN